MAAISWDLNIKLGDETQITESDSFVVEAFSEVEVTIEKGATNKKIELQPGESDQVKFVFISSSKYQTKETKKLFYKLANGQNAKKITLDSPQFFIGTGMIGLFEKSPKEIYVTNKLEEDATLTIILGRNATT